MTEPQYINVATTAVASKDLKFTVASRDDFTDAVTWAAKNLPSRPTVPVLNGLLLTVDEKGLLTVSAFDYEVSGRAQLTVDVDTPGSALVAGNMLAGISRLLPDKPIAVSSDGKEVAIECGRSKFTLPMMEVESYPALPIFPDETGVVDASTFVEAVGQVVIAAGKDETTPMLTGVRMEFSGRKVKMIATDRFRMAIREIDWSPAQDDLNQVILAPAKTLAEAARSGPDGEQVSLSLGGAQTDVGEGLFGIGGDTKRTTTRLLSADFPEYERLLSKEHKSTATVDVQELTDAVKRVALVCDRGAQVRLKFGETESGLQLSANAVDLGTAQEDVDAEFTGEPLEIAFNPGYLCDGLAAMHTKRVSFGFIEPKRPALLRPVVDSQNGDGKNFIYVLMPVRISG